MYLSGMRPSWPFTLPRHQSLDTWVNKITLSPFLKLSSRSERAKKSNCAVASRHSDSATWETHSHQIFIYLLTYFIKLNQLWLLCSIQWSMRGQWWRAFLHHTSLSFQYYSPIPASHNTQKNFGLYFLGKNVPYLPENIINICPCLFENHLSTS
jgi:hypothetical protein